MECPSCRSVVADDARFCSNCGGDLARRQDERRVVTVLFADIVGFTGLSETRDPEQVKYLVDRCFALLADDITAFGGRVDKVVGDAIIALFGAPVAHEDDAERAVRAALRMQDTVARYDRESEIGIQVRIGVNTGEVLVGAIAAGDDYTAMGDVVNTASRLQTAAEPGSVLVGSDTHSATAEVIHYRSLGRLHARGREGLVAAFRAVAPVGQPGERKAGPTVPLIGREPELGVLRRTINAAYRRSRAQLIVVAGESGVGKSRLASEVTELARVDHDARVLHGRCLPYGEANVWWPLAEAIRGGIGLDGDIHPSEAPDRITEAVRGVFAPATDDPTVARAAQGLRFLLGYDGDPSPPDPERAADEGTRAARGMIEALSARSPVLVWMSDLDWADDAIIDLLEQLLDRLARRRIVVLVTGRPLLFDRWTPPAGRVDTLTLTLDPLDDAASERLVRELLPTATAEVWAEVVERAAGNPLFLEEMARMVTQTGGGADGGRQLPANVRSVVSARLDALEPVALHVIEDAAVLGLRGPIEALQRMAEYERDQTDLTEPLRSLERADLLETTGTNWAFRSNLVREVVYGRLTKTDRAFRHAGIAIWIENNKVVGGAEPIAHHYQRAAGLARELGGVDGLPDDLGERAIDWTLRAARSRSPRGGYERASTLFAEALDLMADADPRRGPVLLDRAAAAVKALQLRAARQDLAEAAPLVAASASRRDDFRFAFLESEIAQWSGDQDAAIERAAAALLIADELGDTGLRADALRRAGLVHLFRNETREAEESINAAHDAYVSVGNDVGRAWALQNLAWIAVHDGRMNVAEQRLAEAGEAFEELGDLSGRAWSRGLLAYVRIHAGRFEEAEDLANQTLEEVTEHGDHWGQGMMHLALGNAALWTGRVEEAIRRAALARALFPEGSDPIGVTQAVAIEARALARSGRIAEGFRLLHEALAAGPDEPARRILSNSLLAAAATAGDVDVARGLFGDVTDFDPDRLGESDGAVATALWHLQIGQPEQAKRLRDVMPDPGDRQGSSWGWAVLALVAATLGDDPEPYASLVDSATRSTYGDRILASCARACWAARRHDAEGVRAAIDAASEEVPADGDRLHPTIVALAEAECLATLRTDDAEAVAARAGKATGALGMDERGWRTAFAAACGRLE